MKKISVLAIILVLVMIMSACDFPGLVDPGTTTTDSTTTTSTTQTTTNTTTTTTTTTTTSTTAGGNVDPDPDPDPCDKCVDENNDGLCDVCKGEFKEDPVPVELPETTMYLVGDSTVASFSDSYYYPRYGYGTQISNYFSDKVTVRNFALSGRSSKSFITESNYNTLKQSLKAGDILVIGFGHNDEKSDDADRFTDASKPYTDPSSFGYYLYEYYIKLAQEVGAIPVLCTPIVRADSKDNYSGDKGHNTSNGDYARAIREVGEAYSVEVIDLTVLTRTRYENIGYAEACCYHAVLQGKYDTDGTTVIPDFNTVDTTHLNIYGAKYVAYVLAKEFSELDGIGGYVLPDIAEPTKADLVPLAGYKVPEYKIPDFESYKPATQFQTQSDGWYGTAFGTTGGNPQSSSNGYFAKETSNGVFEVGQYLASGSNKGKFQSSDDGFAFAFRQVEANKNFTLTVSGKILQTASTKQAGFGLMLRDDCYINQSVESPVSSNYVTAGFLCSSSSMSANFYRENGSLKSGKSTNLSLAKIGDEFTMTITRVGQVVTVSVTYKGNTYESTHTDFDFFANDTGYMYVGMFANRGTLVEFSNVQFEITGESQGA